MFDVLMIFSVLLMYWFFNEVVLVCCIFFIGVSLLWQVDIVN